MSSNRKVLDKISAFLLLQRLRKENVLNKKLQYWHFNVTFLGMRKLKCAKMKPCNDFIFRKPKLAAIHYNKNCRIVSVNINAQKWVPLTMLRLLIVGQVSTKDIFWPTSRRNMLA
ncbi:hypothetical protein T02_1058 [Trichinella nativa]|uniref:Uncharacterized protein n=1 Tax=Trichinella nativa TaxID=6335 RepID=A0A0V1LTA2_9BILA|nr:hypothetical protein T02_1058 [Trichinella nativa]